MTMELVQLKSPDNNNEEGDRTIQMSPGNGSSSNHNTSNASEITSLLSDNQHAQGADRNGETSVTVPDNSSGPDEPAGTFDRLKKELNEPVWRTFKVWMLILISFLLIIVVIFFSIYFCSVNQEDVDEKYNVSEFVVPRFFRGNFTLLQTLMQDAQPTNSLLSLKQKLTDIYTNSYALGRYFSFATVNLLRNDNSSVEYKLKFMMPEEHKQIQTYTLSKEMVYSVLLQQLSDQDIGDPLYIKLSSLTMEVGS